MFFHLSEPSLIPTSLDKRGSVDIKQNNYTKTMGKNHTSISIHININLQKILKYFLKGICEYNEDCDYKF